MTRRDTAGLVLAAALLVPGVFLYRFLSLYGFPNDHFVHLAGAAQLLHGEWPTRDFLDPGMPLMYVASAAAQAIGGRTLLAEAWLVCGAFAVGAVCTLLAAHVLSGRWWAALAATAISVVIYPRSYSYPKVLLYAVAALACVWPAASPSRGRRWLLAAVTVTAFLFRHDHGVFIGAAALVGTVWSARTAGRAAVGEGLRLVALMGLLTLPYLVYLEYAGGVGRYIDTAIAFSRAEAAQTALDWPRLAVVPFDGDTNADAWLFYLFQALPVAALAWLAVDSRREVQGAAVASVAVLAVCVNLGFLRDPLRGRLPDAVVPAVLLLAWLTAGVCAWPGRGRLARRALVAGVVAITTWAVVVVGRPAEQLDRMGVFAGLGRMPEFFRDRTAELRARFAERQMPSDTVLALVPVFEFLDRCAGEADHLLVTPYAPEIHVYARRPFAGGRPNFFPGYLDRDADQQAILARLLRQSVPFAIVNARGGTGFEAIDGYLASRFVAVGDIEVDGGSPLRLLAGRDVAAGRRDPATGWPCPG